MFVLQDVTLEKRPECTKSSLPKFAGALSLRSRYSGQVQGMLLLDDLDNIGYRLMEIVSEHPEGSGPTPPTSEEFQQTLWSLTALLISTDGTILI